MRLSGQASPERQAELRAEIRSDKKKKDSGYRARALQLFPHVCGRCSREFEGKRLRELTVHHRDHDHNNNPADGGNWELLCLYCHDHEHEKTLAGRTARTKATDKKLAPSIFGQFESLDALVQKPDSDSEQNKE
jgi:5-methylcytosine-specific restriction endonuclease McrA